MGGQFVVNAGHLSGPPGTASESADILSLPLDTVSERPGTSYPKVDTSCLPADTASAPPGTGWQSADTACRISDTVYPLADNALVPDMP